MSGTNTTLTSEQRIDYAAGAVKPVDLMTREDLQREVRNMDRVAFENLFGEDKGESWTTSI